MSDAFGKVSRVATFKADEFRQPPPVHALNVIVYSIPGVKSLIICKKRVNKMRIILTGTLHSRDKNTILKYILAMLLCICLIIKCALKMF